MAYNPQNANGQATSANSSPVVIANDQSAIPVTGAFFQATQPVSATNLPLPTGASTETSLAGVRTDLGTDGTTPPAILGAGTGVRGWLRSIYEKLTGTISVTKSGAFPLDTAAKGTTVAGNVTSETTDANIQSLHARITNPSLAVTGTFFQATQPVSSASLPLPTGASTETTLAALNTKVTAVNTGAVTISAALPTGANTIGSIANTGFAVVSNSLVSTANSSAVALAANAAFTGTSEDISEYSTIMVTVFADQASAVDGLSIQQSSNGTNWDLADIYSVPASTGKTFSTGVQARFFRAVYTNGATANTVFRLQTIYSKASKKNSSVRPQDARTNDNDFEENMAFGMVYNGTTWDRMRGSAANGVNVNGAFFQATQPVSIATNTPDVTDRASRALGTIANTAFTANAGTNLNTSALALDATLTGGSAKAISRSGVKGTAVAADITSNPVDANTQALHVNLAGTNAVNAMLNAETTKVIGTVNVSTGQTIDVVDRAARALGTIANTTFGATLAAETTKVIGTINIAAAQTVAAVTAITNALPTGANKIGTVDIATAPATAKGTQGANAVPTQDLKDAGRARVSITFMAVAPATADTLLSLVKVTNGVAAAGAVSIGVAAGKVLRISSITFSIKANAAAAAFATLTFRQNPAGATAIGSVAETRVDVGNTAAVIGASDKVEVLFPDGMEFSGTQTLGISLAAQAITNIISISINGFEY